jgi:hypothetical protein
MQLESMPVALGTPFANPACRFATETAAAVSSAYGLCGLGHRAIM